MIKSFLLCCSLAILAELHAQSSLMPGAFAHKFGLDVSKERKINLESLAFESPDQWVALTPSLKSTNLTPDSTIIEIINQVDTARLHQTVQHLQNYGTRYAYMPQADSAGDWIYKKLGSINSLSVIKQYFPLLNGDIGFNVIATLTGTKYPDEYVIFGAHYDSYAPDTLNAPGANDDAVGIAGVMEAARIMSQYKFDRSIIFACWTLEEGYLGGSGYFASQAAESNMKILGYFNLDGGGNLKPGSQPSTFLIHHPQSDYLAGFYKETCSIYLPSLNIAMWNGFGLADDFCFTINGYQGLWNFESIYDMGMYGHTSDDKIGKNVNSFYNLGFLVKADIACLARMANMTPRPINLRGYPDDGKITITWNPNVNVDHYNIYRDTTLYCTTTDTSFVDFNVTNGVYYSYNATSVFTNSGLASERSSPVRVSPAPPITFPFTDDFENGGMYWDLEPTWGLEKKGRNLSFCLSDSPGKNYDNYTSSVAFLKPINLVGSADLEVSFMTNYWIYNSDACDFFAFDNGLVWLDWIHGFQSAWIKKTYSLNDFSGKAGIKLFFLIYGSPYDNLDGIYIDDFTISLTTGLPQSETEKASDALNVFPNPFSNNTTIEYLLEHDATVYLNIFDYLGKEVEVIVNKNQAKGKHQLNWNTEDLATGIYYCRLNAGNQLMSVKMVKIR